jgi:DNA-binding transcriptional MerR regulator
MLSIGEFATIGRVTVRMLRHYDEIGLLRPARTDPFTGYRSYTAEQISQLVRIVELRGLGLGLDDIACVLREGTDEAADESVDGRLQSARDALERSIAADRARLARFDAYLRRREGEEVMPTSTTVTADVRRIDPQRVATITRPAAGFGNANIGPVIGPMFPEAADALVAAGVSDFGPAIAIYEADESGNGDGVLVTAGFVVPAGTGDLEGLTVRELPGIPEAAVTVHRGEVTGIDGSWSALMAWSEENGWALDGVCREIYWTPGDRPQAEWVTDLVQPVTRAEGA